MDSVKTKEDFSKIFEINIGVQHPLNYVVLDIETTGFKPVVHDIIQVAVIRYRNFKKVAEYVTFVECSNIPPKITKLTSITDEECRLAPPLSKVLPALLDFIGDDIIVAHNAKFDIGFIAQKMFSAGIPGRNFYYVDTVAFAKKQIKNVPNYKLPTLKKYLKIKAQSHLADEDCFVCNEVYKHCCGIPEPVLEPVLKPHKGLKSVIIQPGDKFQERIDLALSLERQNQTEEAIKIYEECVELNCSSKAPYDRLILLYRKKRRKEDEIRILNQAIAFFVEDDKYQIRLDKII